MILPLSTLSCINKLRPAADPSSLGFAERLNEGVYYTQPSLSQHPGPAGPGIDATSNVIDTDLLDAGGSGLQLDDSRSRYDSMRAVAKWWDDHNGL